MKRPVSFYSEGVKLVGGYVAMTFDYKGWGDSEGPRLAPWIGVNLRAP